jgi:hypothetical protein
LFRKPSLYKSYHVYEMDGRGSIPGKGKTFLFSTACRTVLGPTQPPIQWVSGATSLGIKQPGA